MLGLLVLRAALAQHTVMDEVRIAPHQFGPIKDRVEHLDGTAESSNWSGYAVLGSSFTSAQASWTVPAAVCPTGPGQNVLYAAFWVGLDGYSSSTVEQTGTLV